jgi:FtsP/CotA-like multicopper oxidase with cupredoxin domain
MAQIDFTRTGVQGEVTYSTFGCNVFHEANFPTPDRVIPDVNVERKVDVSIDLTAPDGQKIRCWGFGDPLAATPALQAATYPSPMMRFRQGQIVHSTIDPAKYAHTLHHHGIEPTTINDGVGHVSFEVNARYTYQFKPHRAGTFFYHCHRNTPLHFEMGMFGMLIVDPPEGPGTLFSGGPKYDVEKILCLDDMDPRWHLIDGHDAGLCGEDVGLNRFDPKYFLCSGVFNNRTLTDARTVINAKLGQTILIRIANASYSVLETTIGLPGTCHAMDGCALGQDPWNSALALPANRPFIMSTAQRRDIIIKPTARGTFPVRFRFLNWITGQVQDSGRGILDTRIIVS